MTMIDETPLRGALVEMAEQFDPPSDGPARLLAAVLSGTEVSQEPESSDADLEEPNLDDRLDRPAVEPLTGRRLRRVPRVLGAVACLLVVFGGLGVGIAVWRHGSNGAPAGVSPSAGPVAGPSESSPSKAPSGAGATSHSTPPLPGSSVGQPAKVVETGSMNLSVGRGQTGRTMTSLSQIATASGGYEQSSQTSSGAGAQSGSATLRVPSASFSSVMKQVAALGKVTSSNTQASDVTGKVVDLQSQIAALEAARQQYLTIMGQATSIGDILSVQSQLNTLQSQIQQLQGQLQVYDSETTYATLAVTVKQRSAPGTTAPPAGQSGFSRAWDASIHGFVVGVEGMVRIAGPLLFLVLLLGILVVAGRSIWRYSVRRML